MSSSPPAGSSEVVCYSHSEAETQRLGAMLAEVLAPGLTVALNGELGSGKTNLVRAVSAALGHNPDQVNSPTFVIMQAYGDGRIPVYHFDTYRLSDIDEFSSIGADEFLNDPDVICFVEWAERVEELIPADHLHVQIAQTGTESREFKIRSTGARSEQLLTQLKELLQA